MHQEQLNLNLVFCSIVDKAATGKISVAVIAMWMDSANVKIKSSPLIDHYYRI